MNYFKQTPDHDGYFAEYGGALVPEVLQKEMQNITDAYYSISKSHEFILRIAFDSQTFSRPPHAGLFLPSFVRTIRRSYLHEARRSESFRRAQVESLHG